MNKQELIERYKTKYAEEPKDWKHPSVNASRQDLFANFIRDLEQLDEPQKPVIQQFVADLVDWTNKMQCAPSDVIRDLHDNGDLANLPRDLELDKLSEYFEKAYCRYDFEKACFVGYEVEKEPLYTVELPSMTPSKLVFDEDYCKYKIVGDYTVGRLRHHLTEKEIKYFDERYWAFAVPVEEVAE